MPLTSAISCIFRENTLDERKMWAQC